MSVSFDPVGGWIVVALFALVVTGLTLWAYSLRLRGTSGAWRWVALGLRLAAVLLCLVAALRPSVVFQKKEKVQSSLVFLSDASLSMSITDEAAGRSRWALQQQTRADALDAARKLGDDLAVKSHRFDTSLREDPSGDAGEPKGKGTALGQVLLDLLRRES